jgi:hypothetical protein
MRPRSLVQRLDLLGRGQLAEARDAAAGLLRGGQGARLGTLLSFGLGALLSSVLGGVILLQLRSLQAAEAHRLTEPPASLHGTAAGIAEVAVERSGRTGRALSLRIEGADAPGTEVVLRGIPAEARLSKGERRDAGTWVVGPADLDGLFLTLAESGPATFDMHIDVLASGRTRQAGVVRVRMIDTPAQSLAAADRPEPALPAKEPGAADVKAPPAETSIAKLTSTRTVDARPTRAGVVGAKTTRQPPVRAEPKPAARKAPEARHWPEGASGLGAIAREPERQLWWSMPPPDWAPF